MTIYLIVTDDKGLLLKHLTLTEADESAPDLANALEQHLEQEFDIGPGAIQPGAPVGIVDLLPLTESAEQE